MRALMVPGLKRVFLTTLRSEFWSERRVLQMLFFLVAVIAMALWRVVDVADPV